MVEISKEDRKQAENWFLRNIELAEKAGKPISTFDEITPARAAILIENNPANRKIKPVKLSQYESDMKAGRWLPNGESIIIANTGELNDGQHRLAAVVNTGINLLANLVFGVSRESRHTVDIGAGRTAGDALSLEGYTYGNTLAAAAKRILTFKANGSMAQTGRVSNPEATQMVKSDELLRETGSWAHIHGAKFKQFKLPASEVATVFYLLSEQYPKQALRFMENLRDGFDLSPGNPILTLRNRLGLYARMNLASKAELIFRAWNYWIRDEKADRFTVTGKIPDIKGPKKNGEATETASAKS